jgi:hypothetical protein
MPHRGVACEGTSAMTIAMTNPILVIAAAAIALTVCVADHSTADTAKLGIALSAAAKKSPPATRTRVQGQIACTIAGCHPIPPGCHPETGYNWDGIPTGFDVVVCPPPRGRRG